MEVNLVVKRNLALLIFFNKKENKMEITFDLAFNPMPEKQWNISKILIKSCP